MSGGERDRLEEAYPGTLQGWGRCGRPGKPWDPRRCRVSGTLPGLGVLREVGGATGSANVAGPRTVREDGDVVGLGTLREDGDAAGSRDSETPGTSKSPGRCRAGDAQGPRRCVRVGVIAGLGNRGARVAAVAREAAGGVGLRESRRRCGGRGCRGRSDAKEVGDAAEPESMPGSLAGTSRPAGA